MITKEQFLEYISQGKDLRDISIITGISYTIIRRYRIKNNLPLPKKKSLIAWNKGLSVKDNSSIQRTIEALRLINKGKPTWNKGLKTGPLSNERKAHLSKTLRGKYVGPLSSNWKGGTTPINKLLRKSPEFKDWRKLVFERDNYTCQECKIRGGELHPHHIKPFASYPDLRFEVSNGLTLCKNCHQQTDTWGSKATLATF